MRATLVDNVHHVVASMLLAVERRPAALHTKGRLHCAEIMRATFASDIYHAVLSMLLAECGRLSALDVERRLYRA